MSSSSIKFNTALSPNKERKGGSVSRLLRTSTFGESSSASASPSGVGPRKESTGRRPLSAIFMAKKHLYQLENNRSRSEDIPDGGGTGNNNDMMEEETEDSRTGVIVDEFPFGGWGDKNDALKYNNQTDGVPFSKKVPTTYIS